MRCRFVGASGAALLAFVATPALAHHVMDGQLPSSFLQGLLSGLGHPLIGLDHLAFVVAAGIAVGVAGASLATPALLVGASIAGVLVHLAALSLPGGELLVAASVVAAGLLIASGKAAPGPAWALLFALGGFVHGYAFGESIVGADRSALGGYLIGLALVQGALATGIALAARASLISGAAMAPRTAGAVVAAIGLFFAAAEVFT